MAPGVLNAVAEDPQRPAITDGDTTWTRSEFNERLNRFINGLRERGISAGDRIAVMAPNEMDYLTVVVGASLAGVNAVPVNTHLTVDEVSYLFDAAKVKLVFASGDHRPVAEKSAVMNGLDGVIDFDRLDDFLSDSADEPAELPVATPIYFTSGTTGRPKATQMIQHPAQVSVQAAIEEAGTWFPPDTVHMVVGPLYHAGPLVQAVRTIMASGLLTVLRRFDPERLLQLVEQFKVTNSIMVPIHFVRLLGLPDDVRSRYDISSLQKILHIAAMMPPDVKRQMIEWWGPILDEAYGGSELGVVTAITSQKWLEKPGSVGQAVPPFSIQIIGPDDEELPAGEIGMIYLTSHSDWDLSYLDDPAKTAAAHRAEKQFTLGDLGWLDEEGFLYLADRRDDLIISGGANIYPAEVEAVFIGHPAVADVGVFAVAHPEWGHEPWAAVELADGVDGTPALADELTAYASERLASYKVPKRVTFVDDLPRYDNGKLHRRELRERFDGAVPNPS
jgi:long-chain acyl-CoA synthetase